MDDKYLHQVLDRIGMKLAEGRLLQNIGDALGANETNSAGANVLKGAMIAYKNVVAWLLEAAEQEEADKNDQGDNSPGNIDHAPYVQNEELKD